MRSSDPDIFKSLHKLLQNGFNLGSGKYPVTVAYAYNLLGYHSSQVVSSTRGRGNGGRVGQGGCGYHSTCVMFTQHRSSSSAGGDTPAPVNGTDG